jgi:hypothetical protein
LKGRNVDSGKASLAIGFKSGVEMFVGRGEEIAQVLVDGGP